MFVYPKKWLMVALFLISMFSFLFIQNNITPPQSVHAMNATMIVNSPGNEADANLNDGICATANGNCTLRAAIEQANTAPGEDRIEFDPVITSVNAADFSVEGDEPLIINGKGLVTITNPGEANAAFKITSTDNQITGVSITGFPIGIIIEGNQTLIGTANTTTTNDVQFVNNETALDVSASGTRIRNVTIASNAEQIQAGMGIQAFRGSMIIEYSHISNQDVGIKAYLPNGDVTIENSTFTNNNTALDVEDNPAGTRKLTARANTFTNNKKLAINTLHIQLDFQANTFTHNTTHIAVNKSLFGYIYNNSFSQGEFGLVLIESSDFELSENLFDSVENTTALIADSTNINFHNNTLNTNMVALQVRTTSKITIADNYMDSAPNSGFVNFVNIEGSDDVAVLNNKIIGNGQIEYGLLVENITSSGAGVTIAGNTVVDFAKTNLHVENVDSIDLNNNIIGLNSAGDLMIARNNGRGIHLRNVPGGQVYSNVISAVDTALYLDNVSDLQINHNFIGTDITGMRDFPNDGHGIYLRNTNNLEIAANLISANELHGVFVAATAENIAIQYNIIGLNADGSADFGNERNGIYVSGASISGIAILGNTISANGQYGIWLQNNRRPVLSPNYEISLNMIGTSRNGFTAFGNSLGGVFISNVGNVEVSQNIISGNAGSGVDISSNSERVQISGNIIGQTHALSLNPMTLDASVTTMATIPETLLQDARGNPLGNTEHGIYVHGTTEDINIGALTCIEREQFSIYLRYSFCTRNSSAGMTNYIAFNDGDGVRVADDGLGIVYRNSIHDNEGLAINLVGDIGIDPLREGTSEGANSLVSPIVITDATRQNGYLYVTYDSYFANTQQNIHSIDFYASSSCPGNGSGNAETFLVRADLQSSRSNPYEIVIPNTDANYLTAIVHVGSMGNSEVSDCFPLSPILTSNQGNRFEETVCTLTTVADPTTVRVGPGEKRGVFTTLSSGQTLEATTQLTLADGSAWWQLNQSDVPGGVSANELWLSKNEVQASDCDDLPEGEAPPVIAPILPTVTPAVIVEDGSPLPPSGNNPPPCYSVGVSHSPSALGSVNLSGTACAGGYITGTSVSAQATPNGGVVFIRWEGSCIGGSSTSASINFTITESCSLTTYWSYIN